VDDIQRIVGTVGMAVVVVVFVGGVTLRVAGGLLRHPSWKVRGVRLYAGALAASAIVGGLVILATPFWRFGDGWWVELLIAPLGVLTLIIGLAGVRWVARAKIPGETGAALAR
jgi:hypothetical protein